MRSQPEPSAHCDEVRERRRLHLLHDPAAVGLDGDLGDAEIVGDLFVQTAGNHETHDLAFASRE